MKLLASAIALVIRMHPHTARVVVSWAYNVGYRKSRRNHFKTFKAFNLTMRDQTEIPNDVLVGKIINGLNHLVFVGVISEKLRRN